MKKFLFLAGMVFLLSPAFANEPALLQIRSIQSQIDDCGAKILNANQITKPVIFVYDNEDKKLKLEFDKTLTKHQIVVYADSYKSIENDDELAAFLARDIALAARSYDGVFNGWLRSIQIKAAQSRDPSVDSGIVYFYDRCIRPSVVRRIIHGEHCFEREMFQEVYLTINVTGGPVVLRFGSIRFQFDVYHRVVDLRFLEFGQSRI